MAHLNLRRRERADGRDDILECDEQGVCKVVAVSGAGDWRTVAEKAAGITNDEVLAKMRKQDNSLDLLLMYTTSGNPQWRLWAADQVELRRLARIAGAESDLVTAFAAEQRLLKMQGSGRQ